jgi:hypothetical protein
MTLLALNKHHGGLQPDESSNNILGTKYKQLENFEQWEIVASDNNTSSALRRKDDNTPHLDVI